MTPKTATAGERLRVGLDEALGRASRELGHQLVWTEAEARTIEYAAFAADRGEAIRSLLGAELLRTDPRPNLVVKLSAEARLCERQSLDMMSSVNPGLGYPKPRQRAGRHGWHPSHGSA